MSTAVAAVLTMIVLSSGGVFPAIALARFRLVAIPLTPLAVLCWPDSR